MPRLGGADRLWCSNRDRRIVLSVAAAFSAKVPAAATGSGGWEEASDDPDPEPRPRTRHAVAHEIRLARPEHDFRRARPRAELDPGGVHNRLEPADRRLIGTFGLGRDNREPERDA
jgi:hypothetical protein